jgi:hypothetical protein
MVSYLDPRLPHTDDSTFLLDGLRLLPLSFKIGGIDKGVFVLGKADYAVLRGRLANYTTNSPHKDNPGFERHVAALDNAPEVYWERLAADRGFLRTAALAGKADATHAGMTPIALTKLIMNCFPIEWEGKSTVEFAQMFLAAARNALGSQNVVSGVPAGATQYDKFSPVRTGTDAGDIIGYIRSDWNLSWVCTSTNSYQYSINMRYHTQEDACNGLVAETYRDVNISYFDASFQSQAVSGSGPGLYGDWWMWMYNYTGNTTSDPYYIIGLPASVSEIGFIVTEFDFPLVAGGNVLLQMTHTAVTDMLTQLYNVGKITEEERQQGIADAEGENFTMNVVCYRDSYVPPAEFHKASMIMQDYISALNAGAECENIYDKELVTGVTFKQAVNRVQAMTTWFLTVYFSELALTYDDETAARATLPAQERSVLDVTANGDGTTLNCFIDDVLVTPTVWQEALATGQVTLGLGVSNADLQARWTATFGFTYASQNFACTSPLTLNDPDVLFDKYSLKLGTLLPDGYLDSESVSESRLASGLIASYGISGQREKSANLIAGALAIVPALSTISSAMALLPRYMLVNEGETLEMVWQWYSSSAPKTCSIAIEVPGAVPLQFTNLTWDAAAIEGDHFTITSNTDGVITINLTSFTANSKVFRADISGLPVGVRIPYYWSLNNVKANTQSIQLKA